MNHKPPITKVHAATCGGGSGIVNCSGITDRPAQTRRSDIGDNGHRAKKLVYLLQRNAGRRRERVIGRERRDVAYIGRGDEAGGSDGKRRERRIATTGRAQQRPSGRNNWGEDGNRGGAGGAHEPESDDAEVESGTRDACKQKRAADAALESTESNGQKSLEGLEIMQGGLGAKGERREWVAGTTRTASCSGGDSRLVGPRTKEGVDACGKTHLLAAISTNQRRRAAGSGASEARAEFADAAGQKQAVYRSRETDGWSFQVANSSPTAWIGHQSSQRRAVVEERKRERRASKPNIYKHLCFQKVSLLIISGCGAGAASDRFGKGGLHSHAPGSAGRQRAGKRARGNAEKIPTARCLRIDGITQSLVESCGYITFHLSRETSDISQPQWGLSTIAVPQFISRGLVHHPARYKSTTSPSLFGFFGCTRTLNLARSPGESLSAKHLSLSLTHVPFAFENSEPCMKPNLNVSQPRLQFQFALVRVRLDGYNLKVQLFCFSFDYAPTQTNPFSSVFARLYDSVKLNTVYTQFLNQPPLENPPHRRGFEIRASTRPIQCAHLEIKDLCRPASKLPCRTREARTYGERKVARRRTPSRLLDQTRERTSCAVGREWGREGREKVK
ncbi:hypothetical protein C8R47DRAFT_1081915 [Mycena vitilis]|nr:hypothetical protein C8R47DRAFT_1081915 [Mycena vitilis]